MSGESNPRWYSIRYWTAPRNRYSTEDTTPIGTVVEPGPSTRQEEDSIAVLPQNGWERIKALYEKPSMETDAVQREDQQDFVKLLLPMNLIMLAENILVQKRRMDYAILRFAKSGVAMGIKCAGIAGVIVLSTTHLAAYRDRFSSWYFPVLSGALACTLHTASFGSIFTFPAGIVGSVKACGLGISSGLTLAAVVHLYALSIDKSVNDAYWQFKRDYEKELSAAEEWDGRVEELMKSENIRWRQTAVKKLKQMDEARIRSHDA